MSTPDLPADPNLANERQQAFQDNINAVSAEVKGDTASIMARYGTRLTMANAANSNTPAVTTGMSPLAGRL